MPLVQQAAQRDRVLRRSKASGDIAARLRKAGGRDRIATLYQQAFERAFTQGVRDALSTRDVQRLASAMRRQDVGAVSAFFGIPGRGEGGLFADLRRTFEDRYTQLLDRAGHAEVARLKLPMRFDIDNPYSQQWIRDHTGDLIRDISEGTRVALATLTQTAFIQGMAPADLAEALRPLIGLTPRDAQAVARRYDAAVASGMDGDKATGVANDYADELLDARAERIARTETIAGLNQGARDSWSAAIDEGILDPKTRREWIASPESPDPNRPCPICVALDGQKVGLDEPFTSEELGNLEAPPAHPHCRCTMELVMAGAE